MAEKRNEGCHLEAMEGLQKENGGFSPIED